MEIKALEVDTNLLLRYKTDKYVHLQAWMVQNEPKDEMRYKESYWRQTIFIRDQFINFFYEELEFANVISTHRSKSIDLPVYHIKLNSGMEFIMRGNFHNWIISVISPFELEFPEELLSNSTLDGEKINSCYCEGFQNDWIFESYIKNKKHFTLDIDYDLNLLYTFLFFIRIQLNKQNKLQIA